jgi:hypothetical protein
VPDVCTCGAKLPPDARFCHKCGKPQRDEPLIQEEEALPPPPPPPVVVAPVVLPIGFHNRMAVRVALLAGTLAILLSTLSGLLAVPQAFAVLWLAAGFFAVYIYRRRTGQRLTIMNGAHLGWICGMFGFVIVTILLTIAVVTLSEPSVIPMLRDQWKTQGISEANINQMIEVFRSPQGIASALGVSFLLFTLLPAFGGAVGAKLLDRD